MLSLRSHDSILFCCLSARVEHVESKTRNVIAGGNKQPLRYIKCYFNLTGVGICKKKNLDWNLPKGQEYLPEHLQNLFCLLQRVTIGF